MSLWSEALTNPGRKLDKWKHYFPVYERHLGPFRNRSMTLVEIGCGEGGSLAMWKRYLGPTAKIVGIDIRQECGNFAEDQIVIRIGDQADLNFMSEIHKEFGTPEVVIDDGSHKMSDIRATFDLMFPRLALEGVYIVEDLHTAYWPDFGGSRRGGASFIEHAKSLVEQLNGHWTGDADDMTGFTRTTSSICFYDSMVVFEKCKRGAPLRIISGAGRFTEQGIRETFVSS